jgi:hypothetical protein
MVALSDREILEYAAQIAEELAELCRPLNGHVANCLEVSSKAASTASLRTESGKKARREMTLN